MEQNVRVEENDDLPELAGRWRSQVVLKRDVFSTIERGRFRTASGEVEAVLRRLDDVPWWSRGLARCSGASVGRWRARAGSESRRRSFSPDATF
jgi:hypothetical protein